MARKMFDDSSSSSSPPLFGDDPILDLEGKIIANEAAHGDAEPSDGETISSDEEEEEEKKGGGKREASDDDDEYEADFVSPDDAKIIVAPESENSVDPNNIVCSQDEDQQEDASRPRRSKRLRSTRKE
jgi:hypothetical protein